MRKLGSPIVWIKQYMEGLAENDVDVPCGTCTACCHSFDKIYLHPDEAEKYNHEVGEDGSLTLPVNPETMECVYFSEKEGCAIYENRPLNCRQFDCRAMAHCGVVPAEYPALKDAVLGWEVTLKTDGEKVFAMALRLAARKAAGKGANALQATGSAVLGGFEAYVSQARAVVKNEKLLRGAEKKSRFLDRFGRRIDN